MYIFLIFIFINIIIISCYSTYSVDRITTPIMLLVLHILLIDIFPFSELNSIFHAPQHPLSCLRHIMWPVAIPLDSLRFDSNPLAHTFI